MTNKTFCVLEVVDTMEEYKRLQDYCYNYLTTQRKKGLVSADVLDKFQMAVADLGMGISMMHINFGEAETAPVKEPEAVAAVADPTPMMENDTELAPKKKKKNKSLMLTKEEINARRKEGRMQRRAIIGNKKTSECTAEDYRKLYSNIWEAISEGFSNKEICELTGRSATSVSKIRKRCLMESES